MKKFEELLTSIDQKLDKILSQQTGKNQTLRLTQKELRNQLAGRDLEVSASKMHLEVEPDRILDLLDSIENKITIRDKQRNLVPGTFTSLPEHLRQTMQAISTIGEATARQISEKTGRSRAAESDYLNQLVSRGFLRKTRKGKEIVFRVFSLHSLCPMCGTRVLLNVRYCSHCGAPLANLDKAYASLLAHNQNEARQSGQQ